MYAVLPAATTFERLIQGDSIVEFITHHGARHRALVKHLVARPEDLDRADVDSLGRGLHPRAKTANTRLLLRNCQLHARLVQFVDHDALFFLQLQH